MSDEQFEMNTNTTVTIPVIDKTPEIAIELVSTGKKGTISEFNGSTLDIEDKTYTFNSKNLNFLQYTEIKQLRIVGVTYDADGALSAEGLQQLLKNEDIVKAEFAKIFWQLPASLDWAELGFEEGMALIAPMIGSNFMVLVRS